MSNCILVIFTLFILGCQSQKDSLDLSGEWVDISCLDNLENCKSRYPKIYINSEISDSIFVTNSNGSLESIWTNNKWKAFSLTLENGYESLLFPNFDTKNLQYFDNTTNQFVYYTKPFEK